MKAVRQKHTLPEVRVRSALHSLGYRFRVQRSDLPGTPDVVLPRHKVAIFVHGCFWHRHQDCRKATTPKTRTEFWTEKFQANVLRDMRKTTALLDMGWKVLLVWECETLDKKHLAELIEARLKSVGVNINI